MSESSRRHLFLAAGAVLIALLAFGAHSLRPKPMDCIKAANLETCAVESLERTAAEGEIARAFALMREYLALAPSGALCHTYVHAIGAGAFRALQQNKPVAAADDGIACGYGFYHGLLEAYLTSGASSDQVVSLCEDLDPGSSGRDAAAQCFHGIGHGIMADPDTALSLPGRITNALAACEELAASSDFRAACVSGVMNALALEYTRGTEMLADPARPFAPCAELPAQYLEACYANMNVLVAKISQNDLGRALEFLSTVPAEWRPFAARLIAAYFVSFSGSSPAKLSLLSATCAGYEKSIRIACREGIAHGLLESSSEDKGYERAFSYCRGLSEDGRDCMSYALKYVPSIRPADELSDICQAAGAEYLDLCPPAGNRL